MTTAEGSAPKVAPPGMGKWNRKNRTLAKKVASSSKLKITKDERREKYTAIAKDRQIRKKSKDLVCYNCRETGHSVQHCPRAGESTKKGKQVSSSVAAICYKCGSTEHALAACPKRRSTTDTDLPFATCFVCKGKGHLASGCPNNANGIYVNGGECKHCGSKQHRGTDCPQTKKNNRNEDDKGGRVEEQDFSDLLESHESSSQPKETITKRKVNEKKNGRKKRVVNF